MFVPPGTCASESDEDPIVLAPGRAIPPVRVVALMVSALELTGSERVLDIGCGSGYQAALLGRLAREVVSVELDEGAAEHARRLLASMGLRNVHVLCGDASCGWPRGAPYQAIIFGAAVSKLPVALIEQLDVGGRLVMALGDGESQLIGRLRKRRGGLDSETIGSCRLDLLNSDERPPRSFPWTNLPRSG